MACASVDANDDVRVTSITVTLGSCVAAYVDGDRCGFDPTNSTILVGAGHRHLVTRSVFAPTCLTAGAVFAGATGDFATGGTQRFPTGAPKAGFCVAFGS
jgi:hypothetical protein